MKDLHEKVVAITGAASGIGRALAVELSKHGCVLALADVDAKGLEKTAEMVVQGILKNKKRVLVGTDAVVMDILTRLFPQRSSDALQ
ncbi:hypothetical protein A9Q81_22455 [Gammaproteobacteria bacterium 42_54_T18]|mgnify:CR=1 FL=1|nr:hypothetical protein A9Q81_22455 [Gammaproteobacteria bacterium 42_54_T18]